jgi:AraC family transcriptional regulator, regulatory protein of adaptative response / methylated-DNA-[protein]-cysteine methyltransferase
MSDYERVASVIKYLDEHHVEQPDLETLAEQAGLSAFHFHRLFSKWAGVTPKDFLQCLTLAHAKQLLREGQSVLNAAVESGLSGPGRLHDLCVNLEALSPGELKSGGAGMEIRYGTAATPFGDWLVAESARGICHISFGESPALLKSEWPNARVVEDDGVAERLSGRVFASSGGKEPLTALVRGTPFQVQVWRALLKIPAGGLTSYGALASAVGKPLASRAVGSAVARNSLAYLIPCHRVIRETGVIGKYRWGPVRKRSMLAWESMNLQGDFGR